MYSPGNQGPGRRERGGGLIKVLHRIILMRLLWHSTSAEVCQKYDTVAVIKVFHLHILPQLPHFLASREQTRHCKTATATAKLRTTKERNINLIQMFLNAPTCAYISYVHSFSFVHKHPKNLGFNKMNWMLELLNHEYHHNT